MVILNILKMAEEKGTLALQVSVTDEDGDAVTPTALTWTLSDRDGTVINSREDVVVVMASSTTTIYLAGDDLQIVDDSNDQEFRWFTVKTDMGDVAKPQRVEKGFWVKNLVNVA